MNELVFKLKFETPVIMQDLDSIKLFGAAVSALSELDKEKMKLLIELAMENKLFISSAFPIIAGEFFFPKPSFPLQSVELKGSFAEKLKHWNLYKKIKNAAFVSKPVLEELISRRYTASELMERFGNKVTKGFVHTEPIDVDSFKTNMEPGTTRNTINRITCESDVFFSEFRAIGEFFFLLKSNDDGVKLMKTAFRFLEHKGLSQDFSVGFGKFKLEGEERFSLQEPSGPCSITLSRYIPADGELAGVKASYSTGEIVGMTRYGKHIPPLMFFREGSYFSKASLGGVVINVPESEKLIYGKPYLIKCVDVW